MTPRGRAVKSKALCILLAAMCMARPAFSGQECADRHDDFKNYLDYQKRTNTAIVYAQCGQRQGKSLLILRVVSGSTDAEQAVGARRISVASSCSS